MDLDNVVKRLESFEDTIIDALIRRAQYRVNKPIYTYMSRSKPWKRPKSLLEISLYEREKIEMRLGCFQAPEDIPFTRSLVRQAFSQAQAGFHSSFQQIRACGAAKVNLNASILSAYQHLLTGLCENGDDGKHLPTVDRDIAALKEISRRIHLGAFYVGECKFRSDPSSFSRLIIEKDRDGLMEKISRREVEKKIVCRVREKAETCRQRISDETFGDRGAMFRNTIPGEVSLFFRDSIIPLTKDGEVAYLLNRGLSL
jgi:chorismate mutase